MFVDEVRVTVCGGAGGAGVVSFRREKYVPRGGPDGGDGGRGGSIYLKADSERATLIEFRHKRRFAAQDGERGGPDNCHGKDGEDVIIAVPVGTLVYENGDAVADLSAPGQRVLVARGGRGGLGNQHFATSIHQSPKFAQRGAAGEERVLDLQLKLLADAGIVGAPNAGKSTLLAAVSAARPKIADYPFTTLEPQLGVVQIDLDASFVIVDVPGLIAGASRGAGLGDTFLRHIERTRVLIHLIDGALPPDEALAQAAMIENELGAWNPELLKKRRIVAVSKQDLAGANKTLRAVQAAMSEPVAGITAAKGQGVRELMTTAYSAIVAARKADDNRPPQTEVVLRPKPAANRVVRVVKEGRAYRVVGARLERLAAVTDFDSNDAREFFERAMLRSGARRKLERAGIRPGDTVRVGPTEFTFV